MSSVGNKYSTHDLNCDVINYDASNLDTAKLSAYDQNPKKRKCGNQINCYTNFHLKHGLGVEFIVHCGKLIQKLGRICIICLKYYSYRSTAVSEKELTSQIRVMHKIFYAK